MAIANPSQELLVSCALATDLLLAKEEADIRYIEYANVVAENREKKEAALQRKLAEAGVQNGAQTQGGGFVPGGAQTQEGAMRPDGSQSQIKTGTSGGTQYGMETSTWSFAKHGSASGSGVTGASYASPDSENESEVRAALRKAVMKGNRNGIAALTKDALAKGEDPSALLNEVLLPAINDVGELFDKGKYFLPQLIGSAEAMKNAIEVLEPLLLQETDAGNMPVVVIATVEGDIHDIGKNLVALMLKNYGFKIIDLGKDVPREEIVRVARENNAQIIALSALMTTTMQRMREVVELAKQEGIGAKIMIGGAVITQDYADEIGADGYSRDAAEAVKLAQRLTGF
ncbi:MAG: corrinoid protein [Acetatifactor sp.]|nr:corrinoid protein [Acetatifactor sp.]